MREKTCCFTGHRHIPPSLYPVIVQRLEETVVHLIEQGYRYFGAGGALGFDTMAAQTVLKLRETYPHIRLILVLPCQTQSVRWSRTDQKIYEQIKQQADKVVCLSEHYTPDCMMRRNRHLVNDSSACICYLTQDYGGTLYTVRYAKARGVTLYQIAAKLRSYPQ